MTVRKRPQLWSREVPGGWRVVSIRQGLATNPFYFSPEGKRFASLEAVKVHVANKQTIFSDAEDNTNDDDKKKKRRKRKRKLSEVVPEVNERTAKKLKFDDTELEEDKSDKPKVPIKLPEEILKRRKLLAARSPFKNLLKRTLVRNHIRMKGKMSTLLTQNIESQKRAADSDDEKDEKEEDLNPPPSKKQKKEDGEETEKSDNDAVTVTPPRKKVIRSDLLFTPPNLTPPVVRRSSNFTFTSPSQRSLTARIAKPLKNVFSPLK